jgi:hypothetical protein
MAEYMWICFIPQMGHLPGAVGCFWKFLVQGRSNFGAYPDVFLCWDNLESLEWFMCAALKMISLQPWWKFGRIDRRRVSSKSWQETAKCRALQFKVGKMAKWVWINTYYIIPFLVGWTSIYQLFWCSPGVPAIWPTAKWPPKMSPRIPTSPGIVSAWKLPWFATIHSNWEHHFQVVVDLEDEQCRAENLCWEAMQWSKLKVPRATDFSSHFLYYNVPT